MKALVFNNYKDKFKHINKYLNCDEVSFKIIKFNNGEGKIYLDESVKNEDVVIFLDFAGKDTYKYLSKIREYSKDEYYVELRRLISALDNPRSISTFLPNIYASRQNSNNEKESKDYEIFINDLINLGVNNIICFENHGKDTRIKDFSLSRLFTNKKYDLVVSPDKGGITRAKEYAKILNCDLYNFEKNRDLNTFVEGRNPINSYKGKEYDFSFKKILIVDDILDSGSTIINAINKINNCSVDVFVAYPLFSKGIKEFKKLSKAKKLNKIYISNLVYFDKSLLKNKFIEVIDCSELVSDAVKEVIK